MRAALLLLFLAQFAQPAQARCRAPGWRQVYEGAATVEAVEPATCPCSAGKPAPSRSYCRVTVRVPWYKRILRDVPGSLSRITDEREYCGLSKGAEVRVNVGPTCNDTGGSPSSGEACAHVQFADTDSCLQQLVYALNDEASRFEFRLLP